MAVPQFHYSDEYKKARRLTITFSIVAGVLFVPWGALMLLVALYNAVCGGQSCDGSSIDSCSPATEPEFFAFVFAWLAIIIGFVIAAIILGAKAKQNKIPIPYTPAEIAAMEQQAALRAQSREAALIYIPKYYAHRRGQITFSILAGVCGLISFYSLVAVMQEYDDYKRSLAHGWYKSYDVTDMVISVMFLVIHLGGIVFFIILANRDRMLKNKNRILKDSQQNTQFTSPYVQNPYQQGMQSPYGQSSYSQNPYGQNQYQQSPYQQTVQSPYSQESNQQSTQNPYSQSPYRQTVQITNNQDANQQSAQNPYSQSPYRQTVQITNNQDTNQQTAQNPYSQSPYQQTVQSPYVESVAIQSQLDLMNNDLISNNQE